MRAVDAPEAEDYVILPDIISKEPLGPAVRRDDAEWFTVTRWVLFALIEAEEDGVTSANAESLAADSGNPAIRRLLGREDDMGALLGLDADWALRAIRQVGNYGEIYERNLGADGGIGLPRGMNALWTRGGLLYAPPAR
jgi:general L-amino acid transport system substrate-binding protein